ncbi:hypothetical protein [Saccharothrix deserti]|uniref:hypothetical protein n=1 Tax=Saccharothrix deserti TaxID=2593674 RepID=UPI00131D98C3|nr:hypothetical protein [Saccharothrix deserti]
MPLLGPLVVHVAYAAVAVLLFPPAFPLVAAVGGLVVALVVGWRQRFRPRNWTVPVLVVSAVQALGVTGAVADRFDTHPALNAVLYLALLMAPMALVRWAARSVPALDGRYEAEFAVRTHAQPFWYSDSVRVTGDALVVEVRSGGGRMTAQPTVKTVPLDRITALGVRQVVAGEPPWITLPDGRGLSVPPGDVVVVRTGTEEHVLPVENPRLFVEAVRGRVGRQLPVDVAPVVTRGEHVPEVLPAPEPVGVRVHPVHGPHTPLPAGPGPIVRWAAAGALALVALAIPVVVLLRVSAPVGYLLWVGVVAVVWLLNCRTPRVWGRVAWLLVPVALFALAARQEWAPMPLLLLCPLLGWAAGAVFLRWKGTDLARTAVELPFRTRGGDAVRLQAQRLVVKPGAGGEGGAHPQALWLHDVTVNQTGAFTGGDLVVWPRPGGFRTRLGNAPALRVVAGRQQWLLPVDEARLLRELIRHRAGHAAPPPANGLDLEGWHRLRTWAVGATTGSQEGGGFKTTGIGWRLVAAACVGTVGWVLVWLVPVAGAIGLTLSAALLADWLRVRRRMLVAEHHALPPGSPDWGETRPDHAPLPGWQPWL